MKKLIYKGVEFDKFKLYREANNSAGCEYGYSTEDDLNKDDYEEAEIYICPACIKKHGLYAEAETNEEEVNKFLGVEFDGKFSALCSVKNCWNENSFEARLNIDECVLEDL